MLLITDGSGCAALEKWFEKLNVKEQGSSFVVRGLSTLGCCISKTLVNWFDFDAV